MWDQLTIFLVLLAGGLAGREVGVGGAGVRVAVGQGEAVGGVGPVGQERVVAHRVQVRGAGPAAD